MHVTENKLHIFLKCSWVCSSFPTLPLLALRVTVLITQDWCLLQNYNKQWQYPVTAWLLFFLLADNCLGGASLPWQGRVNSKSRHGIVVIGNKPENARCESAQLDRLKKMCTSVSMVVAPGVPRCLCVTKHMNSKSHNAYLNIETCILYPFLGQRKD